jgi:hypothetical protein
MIGVTLGMDKDWVKVAHRAADQMAKMTGLKCHVIDSPYGKPYEDVRWEKFRIMQAFPAEDSFLYFDADNWCVKPWKPEALFEGYNRDFLAVGSVRNNYLDLECLQFDIPPDGTYVCSGLFLFGREHREMIDYTASLYPGFGDWPDQTALNIVMRKFGGYSILPQKFSAETHGGNYSPQYTKVPVQQIINYHFCSCGGDASRITDLQLNGPLNTRENV